MAPLISLPSVLTAVLSCQTLFSGLSYAQIVTGQLGNAIRNINNPEGAAYIAEISKGSIKGSVLAINADDQGTGFAVNLEGLPAEGGPFIYHIHVAPVPSDGNCTATLAHLDPYIRGEATPCQSDRPDTCQVGDLAGKHGKINGTSINASYADPYVSLRPGDGAFFGNRSLVIHLANATRIACANFSSIDTAIMNGPGFAGMPGFPGGHRPNGPNGPHRPNGGQPSGPPGGYNPGGAPPGVTGNPGAPGPNGPLGPGTPQGTPDSDPAPAPAPTPVPGLPPSATSSIVASASGSLGLPPLPSTIGAESQPSTQPSAQPSSQPAPVAVAVNNGANGVVALPQSSALISLLAAIGVALWL